MFNKDILQITKENNFFRQEIVTGKHSQVVVMSIPPGGEIGEEIHTVDQILVFVEGTGEAILNNETRPIAPNNLVFVPEGTTHNFKNTGSVDLKLYTVYAPPQHKPGVIHKDKEEAEADTEDHY